MKLSRTTITLSKQLAGAVVLIGLACCDTAAAQEHKTYRCNVADVVTLTEDGRLGSAPKSLMHLLYDGAIIDTLTGAVVELFLRKTAGRVLQ